MRPSSSVPPVSEAVTSEPRKTSRTAGVASTSAGVPSPTNPPPDRQRSRAHHRGERAHHMLDPDHRDALGVDRADDLDELGHLRVGQAAGHLVEQQQPGLRGEGPGQFQPLALEQAEPRGGQVAWPVMPVRSSASAAAA